MKDVDLKLGVHLMALQTGRPSTEIYLPHWPSHVLGGSPAKRSETRRIKHFTEVVLQRNVGAVNEVRRTAVGQGSGSVEIQRSLHPSGTRDIRRRITIATVIVTESTATIRRAVLVSVADRLHNTGAGVLLPNANS